MQKLYIIGNGFDIAHGLKTSYWDFRQYLEKNYPDFLQEFEDLYNIDWIDFSDYRISDNGINRWEESIKQRLWSEFETRIGSPNIPGMLSRSNSVLEDMELDSGLIGIKDTMDSYWRNQYGFIEEFEQYIREWAESINTRNIKPKSKKLIRSTDYFLNFNYTDVLESVYKINDVLHVHGGVSTVTDIWPIMGHSNYKDIEDYQWLAREAQERFDEGEASIDKAIASYLETIYKDTSAIISSHQSYWNQIKNVDTVIIFGWSAGEADLPYLKVISDSVKKSARWFIYYYDKTSYKSLRKAIQDEGIEEKYKVDYILSSEFWD